MKLCAGDIEARDTKINELQLQLSDAESKCTLWTRTNVMWSHTNTMKAWLPMLGNNTLCFVAIVSELKKACEFLKIEKENLKEKVHILEGRHNEEYEATIKHKERECVHYFTGE